MLPSDVIEQMREDPNHRHADPDAFSPTGLLDCHRKHALVYGRDWYLDVEDAWPMLRGTMVHSLMESGRYPGAVGILREMEMEVAVETRFGPQRMTGQADLIVVKSLKAGDNGLVATVKIVDYKSTSEIKHDLIEAKPDHVRQVNMYAWLVRRWLPLHYRHEGLQVVVDEIEIVYLDFKKVRRFTSQGELQTKGKMIRRSPKEYETITLAPITLHPDEVVDDNIRRMIEEKLDAREELPPAYEAGDPEYWRCLYCPVADACRELTEKGI